MGPQIVQPPQGKTPHIKPVGLGGGAQWPSKPTTTTPSKSPGNAVGQTPTKLSQKPTVGRGETRDDQEEEQFPPRPPPRGNGGGGGGDGNGGGGDDDDEEEEDDEDTETVMESENGEKQNAPGGGGGDEPSSNPGVEIWDLEVKGNTGVKEDDEVGQVHRVYQVHRGHRDLRALGV